MAGVHLRKIDQSRNMARFYHVDIVPNLFGEISVMRSWGRIGTYGRTMVHTCLSPDQAMEAAKQLVTAKLRRGYDPSR